MPVTSSMFLLRMVSFMDRDRLGCDIIGDREGFSRILSRPRRVRWLVVNAGEKSIGDAVRRDLLALARIR